MKYHIKPSVMRKTQGCFQDLYGYDLLLYIRWALQRYDKELKGIVNT